MKAVSLFSGGLDSQLAAKLIANLGIDVIMVNFCTPFFGTTPAMEMAAQNLELPLVSLDISDTYMDVLKNPRYGYGKNMNPCIDCHAFMLTNAGRYMESIGGSFLVTGEVLGQRPMSQNKSSLEAVAKHSGYRGLILRPLSAKLLAPTLPELEGWVDREKLLDINGRSREVQMRLADELGIKEYPSPAGGCLLTQQSFSKRLRQVLKAKPEATADDMHLLRSGRHFWLGNHLLVVGRNINENQAIENLARSEDYLIKTQTYPGPTALLREFGAAGSDEILDLAASICARYSDAPQTGEPVAVKVWHPGEHIENQRMVSPCRPEDVPMTF
ncbi:MAG: hypothetical protein ACM3NT_06970 [Methylocystaceae bacterium]